MLELGCGTGRILLPAARLGIEITGLDISPGMLELLRGKLAAEPPAVQQRVRLVEGDMRDFELGQAFRLVMIPFRSFEQLADAQAQRACLAAIRRHLVPGGRLVLDLSDPSFARLLLTSIHYRLKSIRPSHPAGPSQEPELSLSDGRRLCRTWERTGIELFRQVQRIEIRYHVSHPDGRQERGVHRFSSRWLYRRQAERLLAAGGFDVEHLYAGYDKREYGSPRTGDLIIAARAAKRLA